MDVGERSDRKYLFLRLAVGLNLAFEGCPLGSVGSVIEKRFGAVLFAEIFAVGVADARPFVMANDAADGDVVLLHQLGDKLGGASLGGGERAVAIFAHFDSDGVFVAGAFVVSVLALLVGGKALIDFFGVDAEVPGEVAEGVVRRFETSATQNLGVSAGTCSRAIALGGVDRDVAWLHRQHLVAAHLSGWDHEGDVDASRGGVVLATGACAPAASRVGRAAGGEQEREGESEEFFHRDALVWICSRIFSSSLFGSGLNAEIGGYLALWVYCSTLYASDIPPEYCRVNHRSPFRDEVAGGPRHTHQ